jgi:hypothetical protein
MLPLAVQIFSRKVLNKATFYSSSKNPVLIFGGGWVGVKLILHVQRTSKVRRT